jgi:hypothetical protein
MAPSTRSARTIYGHIDPGPQPPFDDEPPDTDVEMTFDEEPQQISEGNIWEHDIVTNIKEDRIIIAVDFGTTFSSVAYALIPKGVPPNRVDLGRVRCIGNYPGYEPPPGLRDFRQDVPTEMWYDHGQCEGGMDDDRQSGSDNDESSSSDEDSCENNLSEFEDNGGRDRFDDPKLMNTRNTPATQYWGYGVQQKLNSTNIPRDDARPLTRFKLNLDPKKETDDECTDIKTILKALKRNKIIKNDMDVYTHYLTHLLKHTQEQLLISNELHPDMLIQFVLCVPAKWPVSGCRTMQLAFEQAVKVVGLGERADRSVHNMFMISEPEAAAECILAEARTEIFVSILNVDRRHDLIAICSGVRQWLLSMLGEVQLTP